MTKVTKAQEQAYEHAHEILVRMKKDAERLERLIDDTQIASAFYKDGDLPGGEFGKQLEYEGRVIERTEDWVREFKAARRMLDVVLRAAKAGGKVDVTTAAHYY